jgi:RecA/RadA recombinase
MTEKLTDQIKKTSKKRIKEKILKGNISTGADVFDLTIGGSYPYGLVNLIGDTSSGKSFLAGEIIANAYHKFGKNKFDWFYDNAETGYRFNSEKLYGFNILDDGFMGQSNRSNTIEDFERNIYRITKKKDPKIPFIYVLDSFDGISSEGEIKFRQKKIKERGKNKENLDEDPEDNKKDKGSYNLAKQKENHAIFRTSIRELEENNILLVVISQVKEKIGITFGAKLYRTGGKALDFYPHIICWLAEAQKYEKKGRPVGVCVKVKATKTRNDKPFRTCLVDLVFDYGIDNISSNINFLFDLKTATKKDKQSLKCEWEGEEFSRDSLIKFIEDNNLEEELKEKVIEKWNAIEESISSKDRKSRW